MTITLLILNSLFAVANFYYLVTQPNIVSAIGLGFSLLGLYQLKGLLCKSNTQNN